MRKKSLIGGLTIVGVLLIGVLGISLFVDINQFRPQLERQLTSELGRRVAIGHISLSLLSGSASIQNLAIADGASFGTEPFLTAKGVSVGIAVRPLIMSRTLRVQAFCLKEPELT